MGLRPQGNLLRDFSAADRVTIQAAAVRLVNQADTDPRAAAALVYAATMLATRQGRITAGKRFGISMRGAGFGEAVRNGARSRRAMPVPASRSDARAAGRRKRAARVALLRGASGRDERRAS